MENSYYVGFSAFIQIAVAFCFGMLYINRESLLNQLQAYIFDGFRKNAAWQQILNYVEKTTRSVKGNNSHEFFLKWRGLINEYKDLFKAALNPERSCNYLASTGVVSALFSMIWLFVIPAVKNCDTSFEDYYITHCLSTAIASVIMLLYGIFNTSMNRIKAFLLSLIILFLCCGIGKCLLANEICFHYSFNFQQAFPYTLLLAYMPILYYAGHIIVYMILRLWLLGIIILMTVSLQMALFLVRKRK